MRSQVEEQEVAPAPGKGGGEFARGGLAGCVRRGQGSGALRGDGGAGLGAVVQAGRALSAASAGWVCVAAGLSRGRRRGGEALPSGLALRRGAAGLGCRVLAQPERAGQGGCCVGRWGVRGADAGGGGWQRAQSFGKL